MKQALARISAIDADLTPLIDLAFLLIVFFVLVARMSGEQLPAIPLPKPTDVAATPAGTARRLAVNVLSEDGAVVFTLGGERFLADGSGLDRLASAIAQRLRSDPSVPVDIRADRSLAYRAVEPAIDAITAAAANVGTRVTIRVCALQGEGGAP
ncbi:MAG: biopolymer transporter ExbD [Planctomycetes bacterium]|nr:biopolymer transporter ExbD [Planctomycetota bacterium]